MQKGVADGRKRGLFAWPVLQAINRIESCPVVGMKQMVVNAFKTDALRIPRDWGSMYNARSLVGSRISLVLARCVKYLTSLRWGGIFEK